jgi:hypothetical protein
MQNSIGKPLLENAPASGRGRLNAQCRLLWPVPMAQSLFPWGRPSFFVVCPAAQQPFPERGGRKVGGIALNACPTLASAGFALVAQALSPADFDFAATPQVCTP